MTPGQLAQGQPGDPSMEDILASIRRILSEDDAGAPAPPDSTAADPAQPMVLTLQESMIVAEPTQPPSAQPPSVVSPVTPVAADPPPPATGSITALLRTLIAEREQVPVHRGGPTIEDLVREEIRPLLKQWLDANLPPVVERLVRAEIERVVGRAIS
jgi:cell pole-organizing protein PopZ